MSSSQVFFLIGNSGDDNLFSSIDQEEKEYDDLIIGDYYDTYDNLLLKKLSGYAYISENCKISEKIWVNFLDDDSPFGIDLAADYIQKFTNSQDHEALVCGEKLARNFVAQRSGKYIVSTHAWPVGKN